MDVIIDILSEVISVPLSKWDKLQVRYKMITALVLVVIIIGACNCF